MVEQRVDDVDHAEAGTLSRTPSRSQASTKLRLVVFTGTVLANGVRVVMSSAGLVRDERLHR